MKGYAVILQPTVPQELLAILKDELREIFGMRYFFSLSVEPSNFFVEFGAIKDPTDKPTKVQFSPANVLAIMEVGKGKMGPNFLAKNE